MVGRAATARPTGVVAVVPAKDEADRLAATLAALARLACVEHVVVVDDGSSDGTAEVARRAADELARGSAEGPVPGGVDGHAAPAGHTARPGPGVSAAPHPLTVRVAQHACNRGKAVALHTGAVLAAEHDPAAPLLFVDADLQESAANLADLCAPVLAGEADMAVAILPPQDRPGGGFGLVVRTARDGIRDLTGWQPTQPLSGMRCLTRQAYEGALPLAPGWGVEVGLSVDVLRAGGRVVEVPCALQHRVTGRDWRGILHRARQYRDVRRALARRRRAQH